jgi:hypothetical protein
MARCAILAMGLLSSASAAAVTCSGTEEAAADRSLLQVRASAAGAGVASQVAQMQSLADEIAQNQRPLSADEKATVTTLKESVVKPVLSDTQGEHDAAEQSLTNIKQTLDGCDATLGQRRAAVNGEYSAIEKRRSDLETCRGEQAQLLQANQTAGDALSSFLADAAAATPTCTSAATVDDVTAFLSANKEWYGQQDAEYQKRRGAAQAAQAAFVAKKAECDQQEQDLREAECTWKENVKAGKDEYASCRKDTMDNYDKTLAAVTTASVSRKHIWSAITHLDCYLDVLTAEQAEMKSLLEQCKADKPKVDHLTIVEPSLAPVNDAELAAMGDTSTVCNDSA